MFSLIRKLICHRIFYLFFCVVLVGVGGGDEYKIFCFVFFFLFVIFMWVVGVGWWSAVVEDLFGTS
jgi:hypothetical protein